MLLRQESGLTGYNADVVGGLFQGNNQNSVSGYGRNLAVRLERDIKNKVDLCFWRAGMPGLLIVRTR